MVRGYGRVGPRQQIARGNPPEVAQLLTAILVALGNEQAAATTDHVEQALGRPPHSFEHYVTRTTAAGHWN